MRKIVSINKYNPEYFSKESVQQYKGICALVILLYHLGWSLSFESFRPFSHGDYVTGLFYIFSGYGLMQRLLYDKNYHKGFIKKRILPILFIYGITCLLYWIYYFFQGVVYTPYMLISNFLCHGQLLVKYSWFVLSIIYLYFSFYLLMRLFKQKTNLFIVGTFISICLYTIIIYVLNWGMHWYSTCILFLCGIIWANIETKILIFILKYYYFFIALFSLSLLAGDYARTTLFVAGDKHILVTIIANASYCCLFMLATLKIKLNCHILSWIGTISLEIYLIHGLILTIMTRIGLKDYKIGAYLFVIILSIIFAYLLSLIRKRVFANK